MSTNKYLPRKSQRFAFAFEVARSIRQDLWRAIQVELAWQVEFGLNRRNKWIGKV